MNDRIPTPEGTPVSAETNEATACAEATSAWPVNEQFEQFFNTGDEGEFERDDPFSQPIASLPVDAETSPNGAQADQLAARRRYFTKVALVVMASCVMLLVAALGLGTRRSTQAKFERPQPSLPNPPSVEPTELAAATVKTLQTVAQPRAEVASPQATPTDTKVEGQALIAESRQRKASNLSIKEPVKMKAAVVTPEIAPQRSGAALSPASRKGKPAATNTQVQSVTNPSSTVSNVKQSIAAFPVD